MKKFLEPEVKILPLMIGDEVANGLDGYGLGDDKYSSGIRLPEQEL